ncbi:RidA family protein [Alkalibacterium olivapovliticus]|uniref:2-iminobutanoate/2-iminopropanoate deaminase n=1 Tax=Alkalibacterium olivapovliticus TaxID=99907 RepID=A0A2T0W0V4_9LACT|nr:Rid family detoxifying hydrolase [Alkalibacterium olivapovliticus]PRY78632.1 2-iminobutanoate/2-iminopropanoate deaminase [Alkalibacterium olivapovliticus]
MSKLPKAIGPYSPYRISGTQLFTSGQLPVDPETNELVEGFEAQARQSFKNIQSILELEGKKLSDVVKLTVLVSDLANFSAVNEVMEDLFSEPYPARTAYQVAALPKEALIEIEAIADLS